MTKELSTPALAVNVRELIGRPGAHKRIVVREPLPGLATPVARVAGEHPIVVDALVESVVEGLLVTGGLAFTATLSCVRCLREFAQDLDVGVQELFALDPRDAGEEGYAVLPGDRLPLDTMVRDAVVLALPSAPLHSPDCKGLCPTCGADLNEVTAPHEHDETVDLRWAALADLAPKLRATADRAPRPAAPPADRAARLAHPEEEDDARP